ncbi:MAG: nodulation protein NfeD, partial [Candidatus Zixiibacteriota bacterium]
TNIGAAHPVSGEGKPIDSIMNEKITNDAVAKIKAAAARHGRNAEWAEKAVRESVSITDEEALKLHVIDLIAENVDDLLAKLDGRTTKVSVGEVTLRLDHPRVVHIEISFMEKLRKLITNPSVVFLLFSLGGLGIVLELYHPGAILPGVVGAICLILALYAFQTLPINYAGVALILLAILLFIAEIKVVSHGLLTVGGVISLILGGTLLINDVSPAVQVSKTLLYTVGGFILVILLIVIYLVAKVRRNVPFVGREGMVGKTAEARGDGFVFVEGALWKAECEEPLLPGEKVVVTAVDGLTLKVKKQN